MNARQKAIGFMKECGFRQGYKKEEMYVVHSADFNATVLTRFMKKYVEDVMNDFFDGGKLDDGKRDQFDWQQWWIRNNILL